MRDKIFGVTIQGYAVPSSLTTILQLIAGADAPFEILGLDLGFDGASSTAAPVDVLIERQTNAGTTPGAAAVIEPWYDPGQDALRTTGFKGAWAGEPTSGVALWSTHVHPQSGLIWRPPSPIFIPKAARMGLRMLAAASVNINYTLICRE
jgi:hypothetical protein